MQVVSLVSDWQEALTTGRRIPNCPAPTARVSGFSWSTPTHAIRYALRNSRAAAGKVNSNEQVQLGRTMEAVGRLASGMSHDFNNVVTAILGYADLASERLNAEDQAARDVDEIRLAANRATALTRQLFVFSRRQVVHVAVLDLNRTVSGMLTRITRALGDQIDGLATVYGIIEQGGGRLHLESEPGRGTTVQIYLPKAAEL